MKMERDILLKAYIWNNGKRDYGVFYNLNDKPYIYNTHCLDNSSLFTAIFVGINNKLMKYWATNALEIINERFNKENDSHIKIVRSEPNERTFTKNEFEEFLITLIKQHSDHWIVPYNFIEITNEFLKSAQ